MSVKDTTGRFTKGTRVVERPSGTARAADPVARREVQACKTCSYAVQGRCRCYEEAVRSGAGLGRNAGIWWG